MPEPIGLVLADDHPLFRQGLVRLLNEQPDFVVLAEAASGEEALRCCRRHRPQVVLLDVHMPGGGGIEAVRILKRQAGIGVLMLTISDKDDDLLGALAAGADGYLLKTAEPDQLCQAIRQVASGRGALSPEVTARVIRAAASQGQQQAASLSPRETEVITELAGGQPQPKSPPGSLSPKTPSKPIFAAFWKNWKPPTGPKPSPAPPRWGSFHASSRGIPTSPLGNVVRNRGYHDFPHSLLLREYKICHPHGE